MRELSVTVGMALTFARLAVGLQAELLLMQQFSDGGPSNLVTQGHQGAGQLRERFARPAQRRHRIAARVRLHHRQQIGEQRRVFLQERLAAPAGTADALGRERLCGGQLDKPSSNRAGRNAGRPRHRGNAAITGGARFRGSEDAPRPLVQM